MSAGVLTPGSVFADRYEVVRCLATGGMGAVYEVIHTETERHAALKVMLPHCIPSDELRKRFRLEARVAASVQSEHIVDVLDAGIETTSGMPFLVMELLHGENLGERLRRLGPLPPAEVLEYLRQTALALDKTHKAHIVHRDLKPDNLFLCERDESPPRIKVLDFGIAKLLAASATKNATRSMGTPLYMAPEQFDADSVISPATDVFALGMIAYTLLSGIPYWDEESQAGLNVFAFAAKVCVGPSEPATSRCARAGTTLPPAFDAWFAKVTAFAPEDRFQSASEAVRALAGVLDQGEGISHAAPIETPAMPASTPSRTPRGFLPEPSVPARTTSEASTIEVPAVGTPVNTLGEGASPDKPRRLRLAALLVLGLLGAGSVLAYAVRAPRPTSPPAPLAAPATEDTQGTPPPVIVTPTPAPSPILPATAEAPPAPSAVPSASVSTPAPAVTLRAPPRPSSRPPADASTTTAPPRSTSIYTRD
ncbi:serine/threonine protein kinase [Polyangium jinanense]|uniref:Serine/threonine protein kinase n=1 Tax=Polyangium jinanense TaxID=2829994 RepID=A0A9X4ATA0_9BACT|nr:serine/threonine-protein kinase [Polyangium jinanense]MDC3959054.1 serine/threonine protein kinase [Polyangium jinanense]MDC3984023.1 serine/threonine protein kinase [Polyangium jinanense]